MIYAVQFEDDPDRADMRQRHMRDHLEFLSRNAASISAAGPLEDTADGTPAGGLWLVTAESAEQVQALCQEDPFWPTGLRKSIRILEWTQVFADGKSLI